MDHDERHTDVSGAFIRAHQILAWCKTQGLNAHVEMFVDGSGDLVFSTKPTEAQVKHLTAELRSNRWDFDGNEYRLTSCHGWMPMEVADGK